MISIRNPAPAPRVLWEGHFFGNHSLALVNRELVSRLDGRADVDVRIDSAERETGLAWDGDVVERLRALQQREGETFDVTVRHRWPMEPHAPRAGKWVIFQPWEYGALPRTWYDPMRFGADEVWVYSTFNKLAYVESGIPEEKIRVVPLAPPAVMLTEPAAFPLKTRKRFKFLFVGGTIMRKGIDLLVDAYTRTFTRDDDVCLVVKDFGVGSFYQNQTYDRFIRELQANGRMPEIEYIDAELTPEEMRDLYHACDCLVHPFRGEGFGLPVAEAMACGLPVIVPERGGASDFCTPDTAILIPGQRTVVPPQLANGLDTLGHAWWVEPSVPVLRERMREVYENPSSAAGAAERGSALIRQRFTWERAADAAAGHLGALHSAATSPLQQDAERQYGLRMADGAAHWERKQPQAALRSFVQAGEYQRSPDALYNIASILLMRGDSVTAIPLMREVADAVRRSEAAEDRQLAAEIDELVTGYAAPEEAPELAGTHSVRWYAPLFNASGYASESRAFLSGILDDPSWRIALAPQDLVKDRGIMDAATYRRMAALSEEALASPDICFQHGPANAFTAAHAPISICRTMLETDRIPDSWVEACNQFGEVWVPTEFNRETFARSGVVREKIRIVPGAIEAALYDRARYNRMPIPASRGFRFVSVFDFTPRKGWDILLRAYLEEFRGSDDVTLIIKAVNFFADGIRPEDRVRRFMADNGFTNPAQVVVINQEYSDDDMRRLYASCDAFALPSRGEGWGRPYMEAMAFGLPTIGTSWSGNLEFMHDDNSYLIEIEGLEACEKSWPEMKLYEGHRWAVPSVSSLRHHLRSVFGEREEAARRGSNARVDILAKYDVPVVAERFRAELQRTLLQSRVAR